MDTNLTAHYLAIQTTRTRLPAQAERGWLADQATAIQAHRSSMAPARQWIGAALILAGKLVQGTAGPALAAVRADQPRAAIQNA